MGRGDVLMGDLVEADDGDFLGINEESEKEGHVQMVKFRGKSERNKEGGNFNGIGFRGGSNCESMPFNIERKSRSELNHRESNIGSARNE